MLEINDGVAIEGDRSIVHQVDRWSITRFAADAYAIFYPKSSQEQMALELQLAFPVERQIGRRMVGRGRDKPADSTQFFMHIERTGLFVCEPDYQVGVPDALVVITFLRFVSRLQYDLARQLYPATEEHPLPAPTCTSGWIKQVVPEPGESQPKHGHAQMEVINFTAHVGALGSANKKIRDGFGGLDGLKQALALAWALGNTSEPAGWQVDETEVSYADLKVRYVMHLLHPLTGAEFDIGLIKRGKNPYRAVLVQPSKTAAVLEQQRAKAMLESGEVPEIKPPPPEKTVQPGSNRAELVAKAPPGYVPQPPPPPKKKVSVAPAPVPLPVQPEHKLNVGPQLAAIEQEHKSKLAELGHAPEEPSPSKTPAGFPDLPDQLLPGLLVAPRDVRVASVVLRAMKAKHADMGTEKIHHLIRWGLCLSLLSPALQLEEGPWTAPGGMSCWLHPRTVFMPGGVPIVEWWVTLSRPPDLAPEELSLARQLAEKGWKCFPPDQW